MPLALPLGARPVLPASLAHLTPEQRAAVTMGAEVVLHSGRTVEIVRVIVDATGVKMWAADRPEIPPPPPPGP